MESLEKDLRDAVDGTCKLIDQLQKENAELKKRLAHADPDRVTRVIEDYKKVAAQRLAEKEVIEDNVAQLNIKLTEAHDALKLAAKQLRVYEDAAKKGGDNAGNSQKTGQKVASGRKKNR